MKIGLGTAAMGRPQYINIRANQEVELFNKSAFINAGKKLLTAAYNNGIRHFDTAPGYGIAEQILLEWIQENQPRDITVSTKWGYTYTANFDPNASVHEIKEHSLDKLNEQWEQSQQFLPYLNLYQIHSATLDSGVLENEGVLKRLFELKKQHAITIGFSVSGDNQNEIIEKALAVQFEREGLFDSLQVTYNIFDQSLTELLPQLKDKKILIKEALANGRVFPNSNYPHYEKAYELLQSLASKYKVGIDAIALRFCMDTIQSGIVLSGANKTNHLQSNLEAKNIELTPSEINQLKAFAVSPKDYWAERKMLVWN